MTVPLYCLMIAATLPAMLSFVGAKLHRNQLGSFGNPHPRDQAA